jgi:AcrR family transcriptional regulator
MARAREGRESTDGQPGAGRPRALRPHPKSRQKERLVGKAKNSRPLGREAVMAAVLDAANELFAARGPASVSVRDIAAAARVNHALVHRHFGPKHKVLQAVLERSARGMATATDRVTEARAGILAVFNRPSSTKIIGAHWLAQCWTAKARADSSAIFPPSTG